MNPELQRNFWLELTPRRIIMMAAVLGLVFLAFSLASGRSGLSTAAEYAFYGIVIVWGSRDAAQAVVGEIRDRTWDNQRLSALGAWQMTWGKLLGSTAYTWFGGLICLAALIAVAFVDHGPLQALADLGYFLSMGLMAHAVAFFASLVAIRRRQMHSRFDIFFYQLAGVVAAWWVWWVWQTAAPGGAMTPGHAVQIDTISWWGVAFDARPFYLTSMVLFLAWAIAGCYRLMRTELMLQNSPVVWTAFVIYMAAYVAGFDSWLLPQEGEPVVEAIAMRLLVAAVTAAALTYLAVLFEPKDRVLYRWFGDALGSFRLGDFVSRLQAWMVAYVATAILAVAFILRMNMLGPTTGSEQLVPLVLAALGFLTRDIFIFLAFALMPGQRRGDLAAVVVLIVLYGIAPWLAQSLGSAQMAAAFFYPAPTAAAFAGPAIAWGEALVALILAFAAGRSGRPERIPERREPAAIAAKS